MKFGIKNLDPIKDAEIEIGDLTIICGKNNVGKTSFTYSLYSFLKAIPQKYIFQPDQVLFEECYKNTRCTIDIRKCFENFCSQLNIAIEKYFIMELPDYLARNRNQDFTQLNVSATIGKREKEDFIASPFQDRFRISETCTIVVDKPENDPFVVMSIENTGNSLLEKDRLHQLFDIVFSTFFSKVIPDVFSLTGERSGISIFADDIAIFSERMNDTKTQIESETIRQNILSDNNKTTPFPLPVLKELEFFQKLKYVQRKTSFVSSKYQDVLRFVDQISGGQFSFEDKIGVQFLPNQGKSVLSLPESSSSVKSLVEFCFYLKHCAKEKQILMIDEPELNLHPQSQRMLARLLAKLVNIGIRVYITTHSDYFIREFNTLIALKQNKPHLEKIKQEEGYSDDELLDASKIRAYIARKDWDGVTFEAAPVSQEDGIFVSTLDEVIDKTNQIQDAIVWGAE